jgi:hypothetical protein
MDNQAENSKNIWNSVRNGMSGILGGNRELVQPVAPPLPNFGSQPNPQPAPNQGNQGGGGVLGQLNRFLDFGGQKPQPQQPQNQQQAPPQPQYQAPQQPHQGGNIQGYDMYGNPIVAQNQPQNWGFGQEQKIHPLYQQSMQNGGMPNPPQQFATPIYRPEVKVDDSQLKFHAKMQKMMFHAKVKMVDTIPKSGFRKYLTRKEDAKLLKEYRKNTKNFDENDEKIIKALEREEQLAALEDLKNDLTVDEALEFLEVIILEELRQSQRDGTLVLPKSTDFQKDFITLSMIKYAEVGLYVAQDVTSSFSDKFGDLIGNTFNKLGITSTT